METNVVNTESKALKEYKRLLVKLLNTRNKHNGEESAEEDEILDDMDIAWSDLTEDECKEVSLFLV